MQIIFNLIFVRTLAEVRKTHFEPAKIGGQINGGTTVSAAPKMKHYEPTYARSKSFNIIRTLVWHGSLFGNFYWHKLFSCIFKKHKTIGDPTLLNCGLVGFSLLMYKRLRTAK